MFVDLFFLFFNGNKFTPKRDLPKKDLKEEHKLNRGFRDSQIIVSICFFFIAFIYWKFNQERKEVKNQSVSLLKKIENYK